MTMVWTAVRDVLLPRGCAGCDAPDAVLCRSCHALFEAPEPVAFAVPGSTMGRGFACATYRGAVRRAILGWKDHGDEECDTPFRTVLGRLAVDVLAVDDSTDDHAAVRDRNRFENSADVNDLIKRRHSAGTDDGAGSADAVGRTSRDGTSRDESVHGNGARHAATTPLLIVPAPSAMASMRRRGRRHMWPLARGVARALREASIPATAASVLRTHHVRGRSVETATAADRASRLGGHIAMRRGADVAGGRVVLIDDIVTTGATMRQCAAVLRDAGAEVVTCLALARTPAPR